MISKPGENRTMKQLKEHYEIEKELANRLRNANREERGYLYSSLYDELYRRVPLHPQLTRKVSTDERAAAALTQIKFISFLLTSNCKFLEIGPGDCALAFEAAKLAREVYVVDVSDSITRGLKQPENFHLILSDGRTVPVERGSINVAYSYQLMEHLHPEDAFEQLRNIYNALAPGGVYICITPNRLTGPHDISRYFDTEATGFHLKEYTLSELAALFRKAGFARVRALINVKGVIVKTPVAPLILCERFLAIFSRPIRRSLAAVLPFRLLFDIKLVGIKT